jgi:hypothetical protein
MSYKLRFRGMRDDLNYLGEKMKERRKACERIWIYWKYQKWRKEFIFRWRNKRELSCQRIQCYVRYRRWRKEWFARWWREK